MGNAESQAVRNVDKRTARRDHAPKFIGAINGFRIEGYPMDDSTGDDADDNAPGRSCSGSGGDAGQRGCRRVRVCVRCRPIFDHERHAGEFEVLSSSKKSLVVHDCRMEADCRRLYIAHHTFAFDRVYDGATPSHAVYADAVAPLARLAATEGVPACVLMYGQTGSGKTFTMRAIHAHVAHELFGGAAPLLDPAVDEVTLSCVELATSGPRDMLREGAAASLLTDHSGAVQVVPSTEVPVRSAAGLIGLLEYTAALRATAATGVHDASSRSHALYTVHFKRAGARGAAGGSLTLVDLAGSEARIDTDRHDAKRTKESAAINSSLMSLKTAVRAIARGEPWQTAAGGRHPLTQLLRPCFVHPNAHTVVLATASPSAKDTEHSLNTLRHACVMDGRLAADEAEKPWLVGGGDAVRKQPLGEIDVRATQARRQAEAEALRARRPDEAGGGFGYADREGIGGGAQVASDARREARAEQAAFAKAERRAMRCLAEASAEARAALLREREAMASGPALNRFQYERLRGRLVDAQAAAAEAHAEADASEARRAARAAAAARDARPAGSPPPPPPPCVGADGWEEEAELEQAAAARPRYGRRSSSRQGCRATDGEEPAAALEQPSRSAGRRAAAAVEATDATRLGAPRASKPRGGPGHGAEAAGATGGGGPWPEPEWPAEEAQPPRASALEARREAVRQRREQVEAARREALLQRMGQREQAAEPPPPPEAEAPHWGSLDDERREAVRQRREQAEAARREALLQRMGQREQAAEPPPPPEAEAPHWGSLDDERREAVRQRREQAEAARREALLQRMGQREQAAEPEQHAHEGPGPEPLPPSRDDERREAARLRREQAEEARRQALLQKQQRRQSGSADRSAELGRLEHALEALPPGAQHDAARAGLRKQLATLRAAETREVRQREQREREAAAAAAQAAQAAQAERAAAQAAAERAAMPMSYQQYADR